MLVVVAGTASIRAYQNAKPASPEISLPDPVDPKTIVLPAMPSPGELASISRAASLNTIIPDRSRVEVIQYTVQHGDSVFGIAEHFNITPETLLWANYAVLDDNPDYLEPGMVLNIPPINGVYYQWEQGDSFESVAKKFSSKPEDIVAWVGNRLDLTNPSVEPGTWILVPDGQREFRRWIIPTFARGSAGISKEVYGSGACAGGYEGLYGTGSFVWPTPIHQLVGNEYWSGHLALDLAADVGVQIYASDSGVIVFSGWSTGGYGYMVMIDHGNGYQTVYAHLSQTVATCGSSVTQGQLIAYGGNSGNSSGPHLHFEVRLNGGFVNPWYVLPPP